MPSEKDISIFFWTEELQLAKADATHKFLLKSSTHAHAHTRTRAHSHTLTHTYAPPHTHSQMIDKQEVDQEDKTLQLNIIESLKKDNIDMANMIQECNNRYIDL